MENRWRYPLTRLLRYRLRCTFRRIEVERKSYPDAGDSLKQLRVKSESTLPISRRKAAEQHDFRSFSNGVYQADFRLK
jgi:hypothetical protein